MNALKQSGTSEEVFTPKITVQAVNNLYLFSGSQLQVSSLMLVMVVMVLLVKLSLESTFTGGPLFYINSFKVWLSTKLDSITSDHSQKTTSIRPAK